MSKEEKKAIKELKEFAYNPNGWFSVGNAKKILNLIEKQQAEIEEYKTLLKRQKKLEKEKETLKKQGWLK